MSPPRGTDTPSDIPVFGDTPGGTQTQRAKGPESTPQGRANHEVQTLQTETLEFSRLKVPNSRFALHSKRPFLIRGLCAFFASNSRFMRLLQAALDTCLDSPFSATLSVHGLHFTVYAPSNPCSWSRGSQNWGLQGIFSPSCSACDPPPLPRPSCDVFNMQG